MQRRIVGDHPDLTSRYFVGRCISSGVVGILDFEGCCEIPLTIAQMSTLAANASVFGITAGGKLSVGGPEDRLRGAFIELQMKKMHMHGAMANELHIAFSQFAKQLRRMS